MLCPIAEETYDYILPTRKVVSCPSFASFRFSCQSYHVISIDSLTFSPVLLDSAGECTSGMKIIYCLILRIIFSIFFSNKIGLLNVKTNIQH